MLLDERALIGRFERSAAAEPIHYIVEELARSRGPKAFIRIYSAVPRNHFPLPAVAAGHPFRSYSCVVRTERTTVPAIVGLEREDDSRRAASLLDRFAAFAAVQCREQ